AWTPRKGESMSKLTIRSAAKLSAILSGLLVMEGSFAQIDPWEFDGTNVTTSANVGIGTTAPTNKLSVAGSADISNNLRVNGNDLTPQVGSWTPQMVNCGPGSDGGTDYKYQQASYVKIGRLVFVQIYIQLGLFADGAAGPHGTGPVCMGY